MKIKVCGITDIQQMQELQRLGFDYAGMIFYEGSKRFAGDAIKDEKVTIRNCDIKKIGVFVNEKFDTIIKAIEDYDLHAVQLHGDETDKFCMELMRKVKVVKAFRITGEENIDELTKPFQNVCDYFLFDTARLPLTSPTRENGPHLTSPHGDGTAAQPLLAKDSDNNEDFPESEVRVEMASSFGGGREEVYGGTGKKFNWLILEEAEIRKPFFLSGGIGPDDAEKIKGFQHPYFYALDVNSRFETAPGIKDIKKVEAFLKEIHHG